MNKAAIRFAALALVALVAVAPIANATTIWDQSTFDPLGAGFFNTISGGPPFGMTVYTVADVTLTGQCVVDCVTMYYSALDPGWGGAISQGVVNVFPRTGALPIDGTDNPTVGAVVPMTATLMSGAGGEYFALTACGLNINLPAGDYWISITPNAPSGPGGGELALGSTTYLGVDPASYDQYAFPGPPAWFVFNPGLDIAIKIEGSCPVSTETSTWGKVKSLYR
ncbi:MAG: hypothetical protein OEX18_00205 [Candidatus Krumholzibacteria bacterium]|nr:hypothetical protein [Candidatus Krumholzibacteria bacterium]MDH4335683.1 hypothetical protein [Candidatus Krumholzibacteria bacterium]MDH5270028.1 hypothetical protein [Candidatus Krumholzibacteria bacterium]MDH5627380.1 hypothetical protein [Candidatus Krumholzibacteria bacterium]